MKFDKEYFLREFNDKIRGQFQYKVAKDIGISESMITRIKNGGDFKMDTFARILTYLDKKPNDFFHE